MRKENSSSQILKSLVVFSVPLILSGLLQQLFNWVDALIVGNFVGETALAGVGATTSMYNLFVTVIVGFTSGLSVLFARQFGEEKSGENTKVLADYTVILTSLFVAISVLGMIGTSSILNLIDTPLTLFSYAEDYLRIIFMGIPFLAVYNVYSATLRGMGKSRIPFVAAITTSYRVDTVLLLPIINLSAAISTLAAQQTGAGNKERAKQVFKLGTILMVIMSLVLTVMIIITGRMLLGLFGLGAESVAIGEKFFRTIAVFYVVNGIAMSIKGYLEGISDLLFSGIMGICSLVVRIICSYAFVGIWGNMVVAYAEAFSWVFLVVVFSIRYISKVKNGK